MFDFFQKLSAGLSALNYATSFHLEVPLPVQSNIIKVFCEKAGWFREMRSEEERAVQSSRCIFGHKLLFWRSLGRATITKRFIGDQDGETRKSTDSRHISSAKDYYAQIEINPKYFREWFRRERPL